jgi:uncharacterized lipoprotein YbaY
MLMCRRTLAIRATHLLAILAMLTPIFMTGTVRAGDGGGIIDVIWRWQGTLLNDGTADTPADPNAYTLTLQQDGRAAVRADCNRGSGPYTITGNQIDLGPFATTLAACPPGSLGGRFLQQLDQVTSYVIMDGDLYLELPFDSGAMHFSRTAAPTATVTGVATYRERIALPPDTAVIVRLEDTSRADAPAVVIGEQVITEHGQVPIPFAIPYDPAVISPNGRYTVQARIEGADGTLLWTNTRAYPVITGGMPVSDIEIVVMQVG